MKHFDIFNAALQQSHAHAKYGNDGADAYGTAQQPAHEQRHTDHSCLYYADGVFGNRLPKAMSRESRGPQLCPADI